MYVLSIQEHFNENDSTYRNELGFTFNPLNCMFFNKVKLSKYNN